ncbi:unnamed protein product, partial [Protopolystoma xenopodis]
MMTQAVGSVAFCLRLAWHQTGCLVHVATRFMAKIRGISHFWAVNGGEHGERRRKLFSRRSLLESGGRMYPVHGTLNTDTNGHPLA